eukprot:1308685-Prymnesium_polylepis.3
MFGVHQRIVRSPCALRPGVARGAPGRRTTSLAMGPMPMGDGVQKPNTGGGHGLRGAAAPPADPTSREGERVSFFTNLRILFTRTNIYIACFKAQAKSTWVVGDASALMYPRRALPVHCARELSRSRTV